MPFSQVSRRFCILALLFCVGCAAQSSTSDVDRRIEHQIRAYYNTIPPQVDIKVGPRTPSPDFPKYDQFTVSFTYQGKTQQQDFLLSTDAKTLVRLTRIDMSKDPYQQIMDKIDITGRPIRGNKDAKVTIVNYDDFQCPFCQRMHETLTNEILKEYGDKIRVIYKDFPLVEIHPWAKHAAVDANCLLQQNQSAYWGFADAIHFNSQTVSRTKGLDNQFAAVDKVTLEEGQKNGLNLAQLQSCVKTQDDKAVLASMAEGDSLGVEATPTLFINGMKVDGAVPAEQLKVIIDRALADVGESVPASSPKPVNGTK